MMNCIAYAEDLDVITFEHQQHGVRLVFLGLRDHDGGEQARLPVLAASVLSKSGLWQFLVRFEILIYSTDPCVIKCKSNVKFDA
jgi:hypothetical protein